MEIGDWKPIGFSSEQIPGQVGHPSLVTCVAEVFGATAMGVVLTGMGNDGAMGMRAILEAGGRTVGQDESTCAIYGTPKACAQLGVLQRVVPIESIAELILHSTGYYRRPARSAAHS